MPVGVAWRESTSNGPRPPNRRAVAPPLKITHIGIYGKNNDTGASEEGGHREQLPIQISDEGRLPFRQRDMQNGSYLIIVDISASRYLF